MILDYKTSKLPYNFIFLGLLLGIYGVWLSWEANYLGVIFLLIAIPCLFIRMGSQIDVESQKYREYIGLFMFKYGKWINFRGLESLVIGYMMESEMMTHKSLAANYTVKNYKLYIRMPEQDLEILSGKKEFIEKTAAVIAKELNVEILK